MWRRGLAFLIDLVPLIIVAAIENFAGIAEDTLVGILNLLLLVGYFAGLNYRFGGTIGKRIMGLRVALPATPDVPLQLILRALVKIFCLFPPLAIIYGLVAIWRDDGRSLSDFVAGSTVIDVATYAPPEPAAVWERVMASLLLLFAPCLFTIVLIVSLLGGGIAAELLRSQ